MKLGMNTAACGVSTGAVSVWCGRLVVASPTEYGRPGGLLIAPGRGDA